MGVKLNKQEKQIVGTKCCNCGSEKDLQYHHIVPTELGGNDILSNMCCVCGECHHKIHFGKSKNIDHGYLIREGIKKSSKKSGRKHGQLDKMTNELKADIEAYLNDKNIKHIDLMRKHNISRNTLKKYINLQNTQINNNYEKNIYIYFYVCSACIASRYS